MHLCMFVDIMTEKCIPFRGRYESNIGCSVCTLVQTEHWTLAEGPTVANVESDSMRSWIWT